MARKGTTKHKSNKQEKKTAKDLKGKRVIASGSLWGSKGDCRTDVFLVECKTTEKDFYTLSINTWKKICNEALRDGMRIPVMQIDLLDASKTPISIAVIRWCDFEHAQYSREFFDLQYFYKYNYITTPFKSYRIKTDKQRVKFDVGSSGVTIHDLVFIPWAVFLDYVKETEGEVINEK